MEEILLTTQDDKPAGITKVVKATDQPYNRWWVWISPDRKNFDDTYWEAFKLNVEEYLQKQPWWKTGCVPLLIEERDDGLLYGQKYAKWDEKVVKNTLIFLSAVFGLISFYMTAKGEEWFWVINVVTELILCTTVAFFFQRHRYYSSIAMAVFAFLLIVATAVQFATN